jgi:hypothetical protein
MTSELTGGCSCRRVRFLVRGAPALVAACHCKYCRRHTGAPVAVYVDVQVAQVEILGAPIDWFETYPGAERGFCARCGSTLAYRGSNLPAMVHIHVGAFDDPVPLRPTQNEHVDQRLPWLDVLIADAPSPSSTTRK